MNAPVAFFDVDETLIDLKSMFDFLRFYLAQAGAPDDLWRRLTEPIRTASRQGVPRAVVNRQYYRLYAGHSQAVLSRSGAAWFETVLERGLLLPEPMAHLRRHQAEGAAVVLLSGSFFPCLDPIAEHLGATWSIGTRPLIRRGHLTGEVFAPMIGERKARVASVTAAVRGVRLQDCAGYGDHESDLPFLSLVGRPHVVGTDPVLVERARAEAWPQLAATPAVSPSVSPAVLG